jgi:pyruvate,water dikinase
VLEIGSRLVANGHLDRQEQVFDLTASDLRNWIEEIWDGCGARELSNDRRERRELWLREVAPDVVPGEGATAGPLSVSQVNTSDGWRGIAVSAGHASGAARVITSPQDGARLSQNEILVAPSTDPGWTPLFLRASAIVMETGGYLSHGAIVAREYGLPAVVNIPGVLAAVRDGEMLTVDGDEGTVRRHPR